MNMHQEIDFQIDDEHYFDEVVEVGFSYTPGDPGRYFGRPEDCYPATDGELYIEEVLYQGQDIQRHLSEETLLKIEEKCAALVSEQRQEFDEDEPRGWSGNRRHV